MSKPILCLDFDGVIHSYSSGWKGAKVILDPPVPGAMAFLEKAVDHFTVHIFSSRSNQEGGLKAMMEWTLNHLHREVPLAANSTFVDIVWPTEKPAAMVSIDDRAITFSGDWSDYDPVALLQFKPWNKR